jgi:serine/threonine-protein kinase
MSTCPKCFKQNPGDAVFCGFCGGKMTPEEQGVAKTVFGYNFDASKVAGAQKAQPAPEPVEPAPPPAAPSPAAPSPAAPSPAVPNPAAPIAEPAAVGAAPSKRVIAGKFWLDDGGKRIPAGELVPAKDANQQGAFEVLLVDKAVFQSPLDMERARRELRQLQKVESTAIVRVVDHGKVEDDRLYIAMEAVQGNQLDELVGRSPLSLAEAQRVIKGVGSGLAEAQKMGVIHRDIAPHNIIVCTDGSVKVRGFGVAAPIKRHVSGTPAFISPEQAAGRPVDQRSNIYSLGVLLYFMLTGEPPFVGGSVDEVLEKHQKEEPVSPKVKRPDLELPARAEALILKALAKSSSRRHLTLRQFLREVDSLAAATGPHDQAVPDPKPLSFETPLHGVTALKGGEEPPPSESAIPGVPERGIDSVGQTLSDAGTPSPAAQTMMDGPTAPAPTPAPAPAAPPRAAQAPVPAPEPAPPPAAEPPARKAQVTGEVSSEVQLRKPAPGAPEPARPKTKTSGEAQPLPPPAELPPAGAPGKAKFRETMWFYKGEVESAMAEEGSEEVAKAEGEEVSADELATKYADDGSLSDEAARRLSLRTGKTQMMQNVKVPSGNVPGEKMRDKELIGEISKTRTYLWILLAVGAGAVAAVIIWAALG